MHQIEISQELFDLLESIRQREELATINDVLTALVIDQRWDEMFADPRSDALLDQLTHE